MLLFLKNLLFTVLIPGTVGVYLLGVRPKRFRAPSEWPLLKSGLILLRSEWLLLKSDLILPQSE